MGSGSSGNALLLEGEEGVLLVDAGLQFRDLSQRAKRVGFSLTGLRYVYLTHEHTDHVRGIEPLLRRGVKAVASPGTLRALGIKGIPVEQGLEILGMRLFPIPLPHDAWEPTGLRVEENGTRVGIATDLGQVTPRVREELRGCQALVFETNHDLGMLLSGPYPWPLKLRILGPLGHLANEEAAQALGEMRDWARYILLAHISQENNTPTLALDAAAQAVGGSSHLFLTYPDRPSAVVSVG